MTLEKRCDTREGWQCRWFALFSLAAPSLVCVKVAWSLKSHCRPFSCIWLWKFEKWWWTRQEVSTIPFAAFSCVRISNDKGVNFWMREQHWDNIPPDLCHNSYNSFLNQGKEGDMKVFFSSFPLLCSHQLSPCTPPLDYHCSSFLFWFSPRVPIQSIFISPLHSLYSCFYFNPISQSSVTPIFA